MAPKKKQQQKEQAPAAAAAAAAAEAEQGQEQEQQQERQVARQGQSLQEYVLAREQRMQNLFKAPSPILGRPTLVVTTLGREFMGRLVFFDAAGTVMLQEVVERFRDPDSKDDVHTRCHMNVSIPAATVASFLQREGEDAELPREHRVAYLASQNQIDIELAAHVVDRLIEDEKIAAAAQNAAKAQVEAPAAASAAASGSDAPAAAPAKPASTID